MRTQWTVSEGQLVAVPMLGPQNVIVVRGHLFPSTYTEADLGREMVGEARTLTGTEVRSLPPAFMRLIEVRLKQRLAEYDGNTTVAEYWGTQVKRVHEELLRCESELPDDEMMLTGRFRA